MLFLQSPVLLDGAVLTVRGLPDLVDRWADRDNCCPVTYENNYQQFTTTVTY